MPKVLLYGVSSTALENARSDLLDVVSEYADRVVAGVGILDEKLRSTWPKKIELSELDLSDASQCVLGQLAAKSALRSAGYVFDIDPDTTPDYGNAVEVLEIEGDEYGFNTDHSLNEGIEWEDPDAFGLLQHLWTEAIRIRKRGEVVTRSALTAVVIT